MEKISVILLILIFASFLPVFARSTKANVRAASQAPQVQTDWNQPTGMAHILNQPTMANVAITGSYPDLINQPTIPVIQAYEGTSQRLNPFIVYKSATVSSGVAVANFTTDGTSGGTSLCPNGIIQDSVNVIVSDSTGPYPSSWAFSNSNKTLTATVNKSSPTGVIALLGINILSAPVSANGATAKMSAVCY